jgi:hypothetical protein
MDLIILKVRGGFTLGAGRCTWWSSCTGAVAIFPRAEQHGGEVLRALPHDDIETIQAPLSRVLATVARLISAPGASEEGELGEPPLVRRPIAPDHVVRDLLVLKLPYSNALRVCEGFGWAWPRTDLVAFFPGAGWCAADVMNALTQDSWQPIRAPLSRVLATVAQLLSTHGASEASELDESGTDPDTVSCSCCRRAREAWPPPAQPSADPSVPRLTEEALAQHTRAHERDRSRSPVRAASPSAEASR